MLVFPPIPLPIWNCIPIHVSINQGSGVCLFYHIPLFAFICACLHCRVYHTIAIHTRHSDTPQVASSFIFAIYHGYYLVHCPCPVICLRQIQKLIIRPCIRLGDVFVCILVRPIFSYLFRLMYVFHFYLISYVST